MDSSEQTPELDHPPPEEQIQLVPVPVVPSPPDPATAALSPQPDIDAATVTLAPTLPGSEAVPGHINTPSSSTVSVSASSYKYTPGGQTAPGDIHCSHQVYCPCASGVVATDLHTAEEGTMCSCLTSGQPSQTPTQDVTGSSPAVSTVRQTGAERPGPSGLLPAGPSPRGAVDGPSAAPRSLPTSLPTSLPGSVCERTPCCATAASQPCHVLSLPDMCCPRPDRGAAAVAAAAVAQMSPIAAAASSGPTTGQVPAPRPSASSGIWAALQSVASHTSFASPLSSIGPFCRICHEGESRELLISPCRCAGSVGLVHVSCIEKWLSAANKDSCEICTYKYVTERRPKPLLEWLLNPSNPEDARNLVGDVICFFLLTGLAVIAAYLCLMGASHYLSYKTQWEATGLVVLGLLISSIYCIWLAVTCRYHCRVWQDWRRNHQDVHLLEMKRLSYSAVDVNNNGVLLPLTSAAGAGAGCRACRGGSYSCSHCCAVCPVHGVQRDATSAAAAAAGAAATGVAGADDVFDDEPAADAVAGAGGGFGGICGTTAATLEDKPAAGAGK